MKFRLEAKSCKNISEVKCLGTLLPGFDRRGIAYELYDSGIGLTRRHMRPLLASSDYLNLEEGRAALRAVRQELGL